MSHRLGLCLAMMLAMAPAAPLLAQGQFEITNEVYQEFEEVGSDGRARRKLIPAANIVPGTEVVYIIRYHNGTNAPAENVVIDNPLDATLAYVPRSGRGAGAEVSVSIDGGRSYGVLEEMRKRRPDGRLRTARGDDVTHLRFVLLRPIAPGQRGQVSFRATVK